MNKANTGLSKWMSDPYVCAFVACGLIVFASQVTPRLSKCTRRFFDQYWVKFVAIFLLALVFQKEIIVALVVALILTVLLFFVADTTSNSDAKEGMADIDPSQSVFDYDYNTHAQPSPIFVLSTSEVDTDPGTRPSVIARPIVPIKFGRHDMLNRRRARSYDPDLTMLSDIAAETAADQIAEIQSYVAD